MESQKARYRRPSEHRRTWRNPDIPSPAPPWVQRYASFVAPPSYGGNAIGLYPHLKAI